MAELRRAVGLTQLTLYGIGTMVAAWVAVRAVDPAQLAASDAPMALLFERVTPWAGTWVALVAMLAVTNGALVQIIMAARIVYGLGEDGTFPRWLSRIHPKTRTPIFATAIITAAVVMATLLLPLEALARTTTFLLLVVFTLVNIALLRLRRAGVSPPVSFQPPLAVPFLGAVSSALFCLLSLRDLVAG